MNKIITPAIKNVILLMSLLLMISNCRATAPINSDEWLQTIYVNPVSYRYFDGLKDDLLTAGLSVSELRSAKAPIDLGENPNAIAIRKLTYYTNIRALIDVTDAGGYGRLYGPTEDSKAIPGSEYISWSNDSKNNLTASFVLQIPDSFDSEKACLIAAPSSGSRGVYGAVGTSGGWALIKGCAVVYTDKGTGTGFSVTTENPAKMGINIIGIYGQTSASLPHIFTTKTSKKLSAEVEIIATKHAHSGKNPEAHWGQYTLESIRFARKILAGRYGKSIPKKLKVIASSISNGGVAVLRAAEQDKEGLIDAVVAAEPNITTINGTSVIIEDSYGEVKKPGRLLYDYSSILGLYQPCALLSKSLKGTPFYYFSPAQTNQFKGRCQGLKEQGLLNSTELTAMAEESLKKIHQLQILPEANFLSNFSVFAQLWPALGVTYGFSYHHLDGRDKFCDYQFAATNLLGFPRKLSSNEKNSLFSLSSGIVPSAGVNLIKNLDGKYRERKWISKDWDLAGALCIRKAFEDSQKSTNTFSKSLNAIKASGNLQHKPSIIIHGKNDSLIAVNHSSRAYVAINKQQEKEQSQLKYYEVNNAQHFDTLAGLPIFSDKIIPLHFYLEQSLDAMYQHLFTGSKLPPSQTVLTSLRQLKDKSVEALQHHHLPFLNYNPEKPIIVTTTKLIIN